MNLNEILDGIYAEHGALTPELVKEYARPDDSPIHTAVFNRPPDQAAEDYYTEQAHRLIQRARYLLPAGSRRRSIRAFYAVPTPEHRYSFEPLSVVMSSPSKLDLAQAEALRRLKEAQEAVDTLNELEQGATKTRSRRASKHIQKAVEALV